MTQLIVLLRLATYRNHNIVRQYFFELKEVKISGVKFIGYVANTHAITP